MTKQAYEKKLQLYREDYKKAREQGRARQMEFIKILSSKLKEKYELETYLEENQARELFTTSLPDSISLDKPVNNVLSSVESTDSESNGESSY